MKRATMHDLIIYLYKQKNNSADKGNALLLFGK